MILDELDEAARRNENVRLAVRAMWWGDSDAPDKHGAYGHVRRLRSSSDLTHAPLSIAPCGCSGIVGSEGERLRVVGMTRHATGTAVPEQRPER